MTKSSKAGTCDIISFAQTLISTRLSSPSFRSAAHDFLKCVDAHELVKKAVFPFYAPLDTKATYADFILGVKHELNKSSLTPAILNFLMESAVYTLTIHNTGSPMTERLSFIEQALYKNQDNVFLSATYRRTQAAFNRLFTAKFAILTPPTDAARSALVPVLNYIPKVNHRTSLDTHLEYLSVTRADYARKIRMPDKLSLEDEVACMDVFLKFMSVYTSMDKWKGTAQDNLIQAAYHMIKKSSRHNTLFLKEKFLRICGKESTKVYWNTFENASHISTITAYLEEVMSPTEIKEMCDFCLVLLSLFMWYGGGCVMRDAVKRKLAKLRKKYRNDSLLEKIGIFLLPIDFSFAISKRENEKTGEHEALLHIMNSINTDTEVQPLLGTLVWARDKFAWLDDDFRSSLQFINSTSTEQADRGLLSEGGNIVAGRGAKGNFILVSQDALNKDTCGVSLYFEAKKHTIQVYALPGGFSWARNTRTDEDMLMDALHIDTVINAIPRECTNDGRLKILVDPYYFEMIKTLSEFKRFTHDQGIETDDIVLIDKKELYLNLANFSVILDSRCNKKLLFNKDKGYTLPRLNLKADIVAQPHIEIINLAALNGSIRCVTNMSPRRYIKKGSSVFVAIEHTVPEDIENAVTEMLFAKKELIKTLSAAWVASVHIRFRAQEDFYVYDPLSRMACITLGYTEGFSPEASCRYIETCIRQMCQRLAADMGVNKDRLNDYVVTTLSPAAAPVETNHVIKTRTGALLSLALR